MRISAEAAEAQYLPQIEALKAENARLRAALMKAKWLHYICDDCWYSCPKSPEGCCDPQATGCTCGADEANAEIDAALSVQLPADQPDGEQ